LYAVLKQGVASKPRFIPYPSTPPITNKELDYYTSIFQYSEAQKKQAEEKGSVAGIRDVTTDRLYFDFDKLDDLELARKDALELAKRLMDRGVDPEHIQSCFTGQKGFSIEVKLNKRISNEEFKAAVVRLAGDLKTFDYSVMDPPRVVRVNNTKHPKSGLYRIPLKLYDLDELPMKDIINMSSLNAGEVKELPPVTLPNELFAVEKKKTKAEPTGDLKEALERIPKGWKIGRAHV
jgi:hypothetical protein